MQLVNRLLANVELGSRWSFRHHDLKPTSNGEIALPALPPPPAHIDKPAECEKCVDSGGVTNVGLRLHLERPSRRIGTMIAGNSGRPGGACGLPNKTVTALHAQHRTQEEDVVANWLTTECFNAGKSFDANEGDALTCASNIYASTIARKWGMVEPQGTSASTLQGVDYTSSTHGGAYGDAWSVEGAHLCAKRATGAASGAAANAFVASEQFPTTLVFVAGPNAGARGRDDASTTRRTFNSHMQADYALFRAGVKAALHAGLHTMAAMGCDVALVAHVSAGIYAGDAHRARIRREYPVIVQEILLDTRQQPKPLGCYFERVVLTLLQ